MASRFPSHQLSNGLYVSGLPEQPKEKTITMSSTAVPYTGGDIRKSGELGKMFDIPVDSTRSRKSGPFTNGPARTGSFGGSSSSVITGGLGRQKSLSGPLNKQGEQVKKLSGPQTGGVTPLSRQNSGSLAPSLPTTGLIISGPISSGPLNSSGAPWNVSGPQDSTGAPKLPKASIAINQAITKLNHDGNYSSKKSFPKKVLWRAVKGFIGRYPDAELRTAKDGQYVKVSGVVTCGSVPLESSYLKVPRCVYSSTRLYEYRGWDSKPSNSKHPRFSWGLRFVETHAVDFYISDFQSGLRALVKTGYGASVTPYVDESFVTDIDTSNKDMSAEFLIWLRQNNLSVDGREMRLKEGSGFCLGDLNDTVVTVLGDHDDTVVTGLGDHDDTVVTGLGDLDDTVVCVALPTGCHCVDSRLLYIAVMRVVKDRSEVFSQFCGKKSAAIVIGGILQEGRISFSQISVLPSLYIKEGSTISVMGVVRRNHNVLMIVSPSEPFSTGCHWTRCIQPAKIEGIILRCEDSSDSDVIPV
ncbi:hypothetical protein KSP39_PZI010750 [Platanthera zijinensis]|uniref:Uncharacterized protein n=1 Tax=Platanthera zijinensis TaxID=2320716 RepID=A0AAP0BLD0_9ASPA